MMNYTNGANALKIVEFPQVNIQVGKVKKYRFDILFRDLAIAYIIMDYSFLLVLGMSFSNMMMYAILG